MKKIIQLTLVTFVLTLFMSCNKSNTQPANNSSSTATYSFEYTIDGVKYTWSGGIPTGNGNSSLATNNGSSVVWVGVRDVPNGAKWFPQITALFPAKVGTYIMDMNSSNTLNLNVLFSQTKMVNSLYDGNVTFNVTACPTGLYSHITGNFSGKIGELIGTDIVMHTISGKFDACNMTP